MQHIGVALIDLRREYVCSSGRSARRDRYWHLETSGAKFCRAYSFESLRLINTEICPVCFGAATVAGAGSKASFASSGRRACSSLQGNAFLIVASFSGFSLITTVFGSLTSLVSSRRLPSLCRLQTAAERHPSASQARRLMRQSGEAGGKRQAGRSEAFALREEQARLP